MILILKSCLNLVICTGGPTNQCQLNEDKLNLRSAVIYCSLYLYSARNCGICVIVDIHISFSQILKLYVDTHSRLELSVLLALQHLMHR